VLSAKQTQRFSITGNSQ